MTPEARARLRRDVMAAEGLRLKPYTDTVGKLTIGHGRNLDDVGISKLEAEVLLEHDLDTAEAGCRQLEWFAGLDEGRKGVIVEMALNLGLPRLRGFERMIAAIKVQDYDTAAREMLASRWAEQVKGRATRLAQTMREGK